MNAFSADWLRLREPADHVAREAAAAALGERGLSALRGGHRLPPPTQAPEALQVVDLGCGTGASLRHLAPRLGGLQHWRVFDHDDLLLRAWPAAMAAWARDEGHDVQASGTALRIEGCGFTATVDQHRVDLAHDLETLPLDGTELLCATALLDLVSAQWLERLIGRARPSGARLSLALMVDGRIEWDPCLPGDDVVAQCFARHQGRDKGFGPALGAQAPVVAIELLAQAGYTAMSARSDWVLEGTEQTGAPLQAALIDGMAAAALEQDPERAQATAAWRGLRASALERTRLRVGHVDLLALPPRP